MKIFYGNKDSLSDTKIIRKFLTTPYLLFVKKLHTNDIFAPKYTTLNLGLGSVTMVT